MKKKWIIIAAVVLAVVLFAGFIISGYNTLATKKNEVDSAQSNIKVYLQRRADLIPNFVKTVKGYSDYESKTYIAVTEARSKVGKADTASEQAAASAELDKAIDVWVNAVTENYPELKANSNYQALLDELEGSENRLATARKGYNDVVKEYNEKIVLFPSNIIAAVFGFKSADYFENSEGTDTVPEVSFD